MVKSTNFFLKFHPKNARIYLHDIHSTYGKTFFWLMASTYIGVKGALHFFITFVQLPYYQHIGHDGAIRQEMWAISFVPWSCKGFIGVISDVLPLLGYYKTTYMVAYTVLGSICCLATGILPVSVAHDMPIIPALLMFFILLQTAAHDLLMEGKYSQQMNKVPGSKPNLVTFSWFCMVVGQFIPSISVGTISDIASPNIIFYIATVFAAQPLIPLWYGGMIDDKASNHKSNRIDFPLIRREWKLMALATILAFVTLSTVFVTIFANSTVQVVYSICVAIFSCSFAFLMITRMVAAFNIYVFASSCLYVNLQGALEFYYTQGEDCVPNGPKFSFTFLQTAGTIVSTIGQFIGMIILQVVMTKWKFRHVFWSTTILRIIASVFDIILVNRWNCDIGIPDKVVYLLGYSVIYQITYIMDFVPGIIMLAKMCSHQVESTMFALLAGYGNFGVNTSNHIGVFLMNIFGIQTAITEDHGCNWDNMTYMILLGHGLMPAICIALVFILIPDVHMNDSLVEINDKLRVPSKTVNIGENYENSTY